MILKKGGTSDKNRPHIPSHTVHGGYFQSELLHLRKGTITSGEPLLIWKS